MATKHSRTTRTAADPTTGTQWCPLPHALAIPQDDLPRAGAGHPHPPRDRDQPAPSRLPHRTQCRGTLVSLRRRPPYGTDVDQEVSAAGEAAPRVIQPW